MHPQYRDRNRHCRISMNPLLSGNSCFVTAVSVATGRSLRRGRASDYSATDAYPLARSPGEQSPRASVAGIIRLPEQCGVSRMAGTLRVSRSRPEGSAIEHKPSDYSSIRGRVRARLCATVLLLRGGRDAGQVAFTSILRGRNSIRLGMRTLSTPSLRLASIWSVSSSPLNAKVRRYKLERTSA